MRGFTLIETMVAVLVAGILLAAAVPSWRSFQRSLSRQEAEERLVQDLRTARQTAVTQHRPVIVAFVPGSGGGATGYSILLDQDGDRARDTGEPWRMHALPSGTRLSQVALAPADTVAFEPSGALRPGSTGGVLVLTDGRGAPDTVLVTGAGAAVRVE